MDVNSQNSKPTRIGLVVPSSNVTVETELPQLLGRHRDVSFSFHSSRMRMTAVSASQLVAMNAQRERCVVEIADAGPDVILYACLVAVMAAGPDEHRRIEALVAEQLAAEGSPALVRSSAGALIEALGSLNARRVALVMPYTDSLARAVIEYVTNEGCEVVDWIAMGVADNAEVGCITGNAVMAAAQQLDLAHVDALVLSACVQMPSLNLIESAEVEFGIPVISAATAGAFSVLKSLGLQHEIPGAGVLLRVNRQGSVAPWEPATIL